MAATVYGGWAVQACSYRILPKRPEVAHRVVWGEFMVDKIALE